MKSKRIGVGGGGGGIQSQIELGSEYMYCIYILNTKCITEMYLNTKC